jgi:hypothetical protein
MSTLYTQTSVQGDGVARQGAVHTGRTIEQFLRLTMDSTSRLLLEGTARVLLADAGAVATVTYYGLPKCPAGSFTIPNNFFADFIGRLCIINNQRITLEGTADLILSDDTGTRSRLVLAGRG